jgi:hypothetical protein
VRANVVCKMKVHREAKKEIINRSEFIIHENCMQTREKRGAKKFEKLRVSRSLRLNS